MRATWSTGATRCCRCSSACTVMRSRVSRYLSVRILLGHARDYGEPSCYSLQDSADACCDLCKADPRCNIWVFCPLEAGCGPGLPHRECWLKHLAAQPPDLAHIPGKRGPGEASVVGTLKHPCTFGPHTPLLDSKQRVACAHPSCPLPADVPWTSGAVYSDSQQAATEQRIAAENAAEQQRLLELKNNQHLPLVYMDIEIKACNPI